MGVGLTLKDSESEDSCDEEEEEYSCKGLDARASRAT